VFDADVALKSCFGQREMLQEMMDFFHSNAGELLNQMHAALDKGDLSEAGRAAHKLKGTVYYLGAQPAADAALGLEQAAKSGDLAAAEKAIIELEHQVELLKKTLNSHYSK
jgi:HPt (histidine-containing phosphotransfer) domain-containing protein